MKKTDHGLAYVSGGACGCYSFALLLSMYNGHCCPFLSDCFLSVQLRSSWSLVRRAVCGSDGGRVSCSPHHLQRLVLASISSLVR